VPDGFDTIAAAPRFRGQPARRSLPEFQTTGLSREDDDEHEDEESLPRRRLGEGGTIVSIPDGRSLCGWRNEEANRVVGLRNELESRRRCTTGRSGCDL
jgi:hypothetical protein